MLTSSVLADVIFEPSLLDPDSGWFSILIIVVLVIVLALATIFIIRRLKKKK
jgi:ABC-type phosphate transport system permease subunit